MNGTRLCTSPGLDARIAGGLALLVLVAGTSAGMISKRLVVPGDAVNTAVNLVGAEWVYRLGLVAGLVMYTLFIFYALVLYRLLRPVNPRHALAMLVLALAGVAIAMTSQVFPFAALSLLHDNQALSVLGPDARQQEVMLLLEMSRNGNLVAAIFWGLWLFPLGLLVYRSGCFPRVLGVMLMVGCLGWLAVPLQRFLAPGLDSIASARYLAHVAELCWMLWLLARGIDVVRWNALAGNRQ